MKGNIIRALRGYVDWLEATNIKGDEKLLKYYKEELRVQLEKNKI